MIRDKITNKTIIRILNKNGGLLKPTAKKLKIARSTLYVWIYGDKSKNALPDKELIEAVADAREGLVDDAEGQLRKAVKGGDTTAIIFLLKTLGKDRGYTQSISMTHHVEQPLFADDPENDDDGENFPDDDELTDGADNHEDAY